MTKSPNPITIRETATRMEAEIVKSALSSFGIESFITGDDCGGQRASFITVRRVQVQVSARDAEAAEQVLSEEYTNAE
jgi:hypothetical protein